MVQDIPLWSKEEAEKIFQDIEENEGRGEWIDIDWKSELCGRNLCVFMVRKGLRIGF